MTFLSPLVRCKIKIQYRTGHTNCSKPFNSLAKEDYENSISSQYMVIIESVFEINTADIIDNIKTNGCVYNTGAGYRPNKS